MKGEKNSNSSSIRYSWVGRPSIKNDELVQYLSTLKPDYEKIIPLNNNLNHYLFEFVYLNDIDRKESNKRYKSRDQILVPLNFTIEINNETIKYSEKEQIIIGIREILSSLLPPLIRQIVSEVTIDRYVLDTVDTEYQTEKEIIMFTPLTDDTPSGTEMIYIPTVQYQYIRNQINISSIIGYTLLTSDLLGLYLYKDQILEQYYYNNPIIDSDSIFPLDSDLKFYCDNILIKIDSKKDNEIFGKNHIPSGNIRDDKTIQPGLINNMISNLRFDGYFTLKISSFSPLDIDIIMEIAELWDTEVICTIPIGIDTVMILKTKISFNMSPEQWFNKALIAVKSGNLPSYSLYGSWIGSEISNRSQIIFRYATNLAFHNICKREGKIDKNNYEKFHPLILSLSGISIGPTLEITAQFGSYKQAKLITKELKDIFQERGSWTIITCNNPYEEITDNSYKIAMRWLYCRAYPNYLPLVIGDYLVINSDRDITVRPAPSTILSPLGTVELKPKTTLDQPISLGQIESLRSELLNYIKSVCVTDRDPITYSSFSDLDLEQLSKIVIVSDHFRKGSNQRSFCFTIETINSIISTNFGPINPFTKIPFSQQILNQLSLGINNIVSVGPLPGIINQDQIPVVKSYAGKVEYKQNQSGYYQYRIMFECDQRSLPLFNIKKYDQLDLDSLKESTQKYWDYGGFNSLWSSHYGIETNKQSFVVPKQIVPLILAPNSEGQSRYADQYIKSGAIYITNNY